ncbi:MAG: glycoside hydrolase family 2 protein [Ruminococcus sp.]|nr:glycoside hydrolase family 2 protein [Ruminococcus sp.]
MKQSLNGTWRLSSEALGAGRDIPADVPGSFYCALLKEGLADNPYYGENEAKISALSENGCVYSTKFDLNEQMLSAERILLKFNGIDTAAEIILNGNSLGRVNNMHREYVYDVTDIIWQEGNSLTVDIKSPVKYIREKNAETPLWGVSTTMAGYPHIRKAHYMFGWDWGPQLPDMGIWRGAELIGINGGMIDSVYVRQDHSKFGSEKAVSLDLEVSLAKVSADDLAISLVVTAPDGNALYMETDLNGAKKKTLTCRIDNAELWFPRGYGEQPLYKVSVRLIKHDLNEAVDEYSANIGLRTVTVSREKDENGEEFAFTVNGVKIFAMGANYVPESQLIPICSQQETEHLLRQCCLANFNMIRVWGGGFYPEDYFYDYCDRKGLLVWQDFMFACSVYKADVEFCENVKHEIIDNVKRLRNHPSLAMWCGNNEIESMWQYWGIDADPEYKKDYLRIFEVLIPKVLDFYDPVTYYHPSSPSSEGSFNESSAENKGDSHYWDVWHGLKPVTEYGRHNFRFCSEYGFESIPALKTVLSFAEEEDLNLMSPVMEAHQKCENGNEKMMYYLASMCHYPYDFEGLIYASQLVQADAVRMCAEHMRRNRGVCMGSLYWQLNDSNPVISWSSIDCAHRWKALHYYAKRFYAPVLISADSSDPDNIVLNVSSERQYEFTASVRWQSCLNTGELIGRGGVDVLVKPLSASNFITLTPEQTGISPDMRNKAYIIYSVVEKGMELSSGTCLLTRFKSFKFLDPRLSCEITDMGSRFQLCVCSDAFAKGVRLELKIGDCRFSDNWFDLHGRSVNVYISKSRLPKGITAAELKENLTMTSYYEAMRLGGKKD